MGPWVEQNHTVKVIFVDNLDTVFFIQYAVKRLIFVMFFELNKRVDHCTFYYLCGSLSLPIGGFGSKMYWNRRGLVFMGCFNRLSSIQIMLSNVPNQWCSASAGFYVDFMAFCSEYGTKVGFFRIWNQIVFCHFLLPVSPSFWWNHLW